MSTFASPKAAESTAVNEALKARLAPKQAPQAAPVDITANPVAKIVFNPEATPEERSRQVGALLWLRKHRAAAWVGIFQNQPMPLQPEQIGRIRWRRRRGLPD